MADDRGDNDPEPADIGPYQTTVDDAARLMGVPVALFGQLEGDRELIRAVTGWNIDHLPLSSSLARPILEHDDLLLIADAATDVRLAAHPLVAGGPRVRFIAGIPVSAGNATTGALYVCDTRPRSTNDPRVEYLRLLAERLSGRLAVESLRRSASERKERVATLEDLLRENEERFTDLFAANDDLIITFDAGGRVLHRNTAAAEVWGEGPASISLFDRVAREALESFKDAFARVMRTGEAEMVETVLEVKGSRLVVEGPLRPKSIDGVTVMGRACLRDITNRKELEDALGRARDAALEASRLKSQFLSNISHEIRTPMNGISGMIDLLQSTSLTVEQRELAHIARSSCDQLLSIINNVLQISQIEAGTLASSTSEFDLFRTLQRMVEVTKVAALGKDLELVLDYDRKLPLILRGDPGRIRQVVMNLLENAIKFTDAGDVTLRIVLETTTDSHYIVRFSVKDSGIGISREDQEKLFQRFSQVDASLTRRYEGVGLGLVTAKMIVETMGGVIGVDSRPGAGSTFWFTIPFPRPRGRSVPIASSHLELEGMRVLLFDQSPTSRRTIQHYLDVTWEMRSTSVGTGAEALKELRAAAVAGDPYRVVLFDRMLDMEATAFARVVKSDPMLLSTGLVFLLSLGERVDDELLRSVGISARTAKPVGQAELFDCLVAAVARDAIALPRVEPPAPISFATPPPIPLEQRSSIRILIAEDNLLNLKLTLNQIQKLGYTADAVSNGLEVLQALERHDYDVILMDCQMPVMDGYQASMEIRRREEGGRRRRIIALTAHALDADREKCLAAGMDDYLAKPTRIEQLELALARSFQASSFI